MAVTKQQKVDILNDLVAKFKEAKSIGFSTTNTLTVENFSALRTKLREVNATYTLAKKTLIKRALKEALDIEVDLIDLPGQIWVVCSNDDAIAWLSKVNEYIKTINGPKGDAGKMTWAISVFEWEVKGFEETKVIASMPSRETLLSRLVGSMKSPISGLARFFDAAAKELETSGKTKVGELEWGKVEETTPVAEAPKEEAKAEEKVEETKSEEVKEEAATATETPAEEEKEKKDASAEASAKAEEPKAE